MEIFGKDGKKAEPHKDHTNVVESGRAGADGYAE